MAATVTRAPLRLSLGGGGTDLPSHYRRAGGFVVSAAIDRYVHVVATPAFGRRYVLKHLHHEDAGAPEEVEHPILRAALSRHWGGPPLELASVADVPPGTGLGSSGSYAVCVLKALKLAGGRDASAGELAEAACELEIDMLGRAVGKQDQYAAAHGGVCAYSFNPDDSVDVRRLRLDDDVLRALREQFLLFYTGTERSASELLSHQVSRTLAGDEEVARKLDRGAELARETAVVLESGALDRLGPLIDEGWELKRARAPGALPAQVEQLRERARGSGADAATLMGAGGGGFLLVYTRDPAATRAAMGEADAPELEFGLDDRGCVALEPARPD
ncbi:MAG: galactokinase [Thermoleophilaceae bacterium]